MKRSLISMLIGALVLPLSLLGQGNFAVSGTATQLVNADELIITVGVYRENSDAKNVFESTHKVISNAIAYLEKKKGVKKVETEQISLVNLSQHTAAPARFGGRQMLSVTLTDFSLYDEIMQELIGMGLNNIGQVRFTVSNLTQIKQEVQLQAIRAAKEKAKKFADELGITLGKISSFHEQNMQISANRYANYYEADAGMSGQTSIAPNQVEVTLTVNLEYNIEYE